VAAVAPTAERTYEVSLPKLKPVKVKAGSKAEAFEKYKAAEGILDSDHMPTIRVVNDGPG
jgi:hypothetical protein